MATIYKYESGKETILISHEELTNILIRTREKSVREFAEMIRNNGNTKNNWYDKELNKLVEEYLKKDTKKMGL